MSSIFEKNSAPQTLRTIEQLELLEVLTSASASVGTNAGEPEQVLAALSIHIRQLVRFDTLGFFLADASTGEFLLTDCEPAHAAAELETTTAAAIHSGTFAWALRQSRAVMIKGTGPDQPTLVLHSIATRSRCLGMFAGLAHTHRVHENDISIRLLSVLISQAAYALENAALQKRVRQHNQELEKTVRERTAQLELTVQAAQESAVVKARFLANMSHEIRTPLNGILGLAELLETTPLDTEQQSDIRTIRECGQNLLKILSDILDYSKIEAGKLSIESEPFSLRTSIQDAGRLMQPLATRKGLTLEVDIDSIVPDRVVGDQTRLKQVLHNLLGNAIKFTETGSVTIAASVANGGFKTDTRDHVLIQFEIRDTGIGIPPNVISTLFKPFTQADSSTSRIYGGTGLGLAICRSLTNLMGGDIWVESEIGKGSNFRFEIPFTLVVSSLPEPTLVHATRPAFDGELGTSHPLTILLVDDSAVNRMVVARLLEKFGYTAVQASNGREALDRISRQAYDLILLDLQMPEVDGYEVIRVIHSRFRTPRRPRVVAMTANALQEDRDRCFSAGFDEFLPKPFSSAQLKEILLGTATKTPSKSTATAKAVS